MMLLLQHYSKSPICPPQVPSGVSSTLPSEDRPSPVSVDSVDKVAQLTHVVERLVEQVDRL